ncbi:MAG: hypothetical protein WBL88_01050 [Nitrososphaeraceae archaeon]
MLASVEIIENPKESIDRAYDISISARDELLLVFPTTNSFRRNVCIGISMQILKDDTKNNVYEAAGLSIYSNNKSIVSSYQIISLFRSFAIITHDNKDILTETI